MAKALKTNVARILEAAGIYHEVIGYDAADGDIDATAVAKKIGVEPGALFKTLVGRTDKGIFVFCVPGDRDLDLKKAAHAAGGKKLELLAVKELLPLTGYVRGGCSPIGMKKPYPLFIDSSAKGRDLVVVSGGRIGIQIRIDPKDLIRITGAEFADLSVGANPADRRTEPKPRD
jgi:Cys-tRNA(Pro)/Cys-tRNA(Cys) deacylase